jgi:hypothetical protein
MRPAGSRTSFGWGGDNNKNISSLLFVGGEKIGLKRRRVRPLLNIIWPKVAINLCWDTNLQRKIEAYFFLLLSTLMQTNTYVLLIKMSPISLRASGIENCWPKEKQKFAGRIMQKGKEFVSKIFSPQQLMTKGKPRKEAPDDREGKMEGAGEGIHIMQL